MFGKVAKTALGTRTGSKASQGVLRAAVGTKTGRKASRVGARYAAKAGKGLGKAGLKAGQVKGPRSIPSLHQPVKNRFMKYGFFALLGVGIGAWLWRSKNGQTSSSFTNTTGHHAPDAGSPAGERGRTWGTGTPTGATSAGPGPHQQPDDSNRTGAERDYSDPSSGPLVGERHRATAGDVPEQQDEVEQRIRSDIGTDPRTAEMARVNVEVNDGVAELRGEAPSEEAKRAAGEIASRTEGVRDVRNLLTVNPEGPSRERSAGEPDRPS